MQKLIAFCLVIIFSGTNLSAILEGDILQRASAAVVTIDDTVSTNGPSHVRGQPSTVFIDDQTGYVFYRNGNSGAGTNGLCVYKKTTDGGDTWGIEVVFDSQSDCQNVVVWYDGWTPGDTGSSIHIVTMDNGSDSLWYNRLDTVSDTLLLSSSPVVITGTQNPLSITAAAANHSLTKSTDGDLYVALADNADRFVLSCSSLCNLAGSWTEVGDGTFMDADEDRTILLPLDDGDILLINRDISANSIRSKEWNGSTWSASWLTVETPIPENSVYDIQMSAVRSPVTGDVYLAYIADANNFTAADHDIAIAKYSAGSWSNLSDYTTNDVRGITNIALSIDKNTDDVYIAYSVTDPINSTSDASVYWASSTPDLISWGSEQGPVNTVAGNIYGVNFNYFSDERLYLTWTDSIVDELFGDTIADVSPITVVSSVGSQVSEIRASTSDFYLGGMFIINENISSRNVTDIIIAESGSVDAANSLNNIRLLYDLDSSFPYDCSSESFDSSDSQYGSIDTNGFSGADGTSAFNDSVSISTTQAMCVYVVLDVLKQAEDGTDIDVRLDNPETSVLVSGGVTAIPVLPVEIDGVTDIIDSNLTQTNFHFRNDDGNELSATSRTSGSEDIQLNALQQETPVRLRIAVSNEGSTSSVPTTLNLQYSLNTSTCEESIGWTDVDEVGGDWDPSNSTFVTDGVDTTDISIGIGGVSNPNLDFISANGAQKDINTTLAPLTFSITNWTEAEFAIVASTSATEGNNYCFRLSDSGQPIQTYLNYPETIIAADVQIRATGTQFAITDIPTANFYTGGTFIIDENNSSRNVTEITISENGTVDGSTSLTNMRLLYENDTTFPYDCDSVSYDGNETLFGIAGDFNADNGSVTFSSSVPVSLTSSICVYPVLDINENARNGETINIIIDAASSNVQVTGGGSISPSTAVDLTGSTTLRGGIVTQTGYHWRIDDGSESSASSATGGIADTAISNFPRGNTIRLRVGLSNEGSTTSVPSRYGLEYGIKSTTCESISLWTDTDGGGISWSMFDTPNLTNGADTIDLDLLDGGVSDSNSFFQGSNSGIADTESFTGTTTLNETQYLDLEYSITSTINTPYEAEYCFRVTKNGQPLLAYDTYPEIAIEANRDFKIQRGTTTVSGVSQTLTAGVDYDAPSSSTTAFVRISNAHHTGAGRNFAGNQNSDDFTAYISNPENIETSFTISRDIDSINNTFVAWEIVEYIGPVGGDNEIVVRSQQSVSLGAGDTTVTGDAVTGVLDDDDVVVFVTGQLHSGGNRSEAFAHQFTSDWLLGTDEPTFERGATGNNPAELSYAVVEFVGLNWRIQRVEHEYTNVGVTETAPISAVNSLARTFLHVQKRYDSSISMANFGHEVWLSSIGAVSFLLEPDATVFDVNHTGVAWVVENLQTGTGEMLVQRSNGNTTGGTAPVVLSVPISTPLNGLNNASIFMMTSLNNTGNRYPRVMAGANIVSTTTYQIFRSDTGNTLAYRTEIVQWPAADLAVRQNYYRFYVDNDDLLPTDPWPDGPTNLGEINPIGALDEPLADNDRVRIRMTTRVVNATLPAGFLETKLQYAERITTCSAVSTWNNIGGPGSGEIWRSFNAPTISDGSSLSTNPPNPGDLLLSVSDRAGRYTENSPSIANQFAVLDGEDVEFDWLVEQNGASQRTTYCFRMIKGNDLPLDGYLYYPQIRTEGYTPVLNTWRWFDDELSLTPSSPLAAENTTPTNFEKGTALKLRVNLDEIKNLTQINARFKLQFAEKADFSDVADVVSTTSCTGTSKWCYFEGAGEDNQVISESLLSQADSCVGGVGSGCGTRNESPDYLNGFTHNGGDNVEYEFSLFYTEVDRNFGRVYYFRLYDLANEEVVIASSTNPSLSGESASLVFTVSGVDSGTSIAGITTDATSTPTTIDFGVLEIGIDKEVAQSITVNTNATEGYQVYKYVDQQLLSPTSDSILPITSTNATPQGWLTACPLSAVSCSGYHTTDATLAGPSSRFSPIDSYAPFSTVLQEIMHSSVPSEDTENIVYRLRIGATQPIGNYTTRITYIAVPVF